MNKTITLVLFLCMSFYGHAQNAVKGSVSDSVQAPIPFCPMALMNASDSSLVKGNVSDSSGNFIFENIKPGNYFIKFNSIGYSVTNTAPFVVDSLSQIIFPPTVLQAEGVNLKEVSVVVYKPAIEFKKGMVVMNVEDDLLAKGNTVLELLKRLPGVIVDAQNNITINGIGGARFLIDDRLQQMPAPQVIDMLSGMSADVVSKIELIKNPPARYDASGTGGLINIVTKKAKLKGYNGSVAYGTSMGKRLRTGPSGSFNYKSNKLSVFSNFSYGYWNGVNESESSRKLTANGNTEEFNSWAVSESFQRVFSASGGIEYDITPKTLIGLYVNGNHNNDHYLTNSETVISNSNAFNYGRFTFSTKDTYKQLSPNYNLSLMHKIDSTGGQIKLSAGYSNFLEKQDKQNENHFYDHDQEIAPASTYNTFNDRDFKVYTQKLDINKSFKNKLSLETGLKSTFTDNNSFTELKFNNQSTGFFTGDTTLYNVYEYKERILAGYITLARSWDKLGFSIGLRPEDTEIHAKDLKTGYTFSRSYFNVFPSASIDIMPNKKHTITTAYSYRIDRPWYGMLNPVRTFNEQLNYSVGNPELRPQYTHAINIDHNYNQFITQSIGATMTKDFTFWYSYTPSNSKVIVDTIFNFPVRNEYYYSLSAQKRIKWYSFQAYVVGMYRTLQAKIMADDVSSHNTNVYFNLNQEFYLPKDFKIQIWCGRGSQFKDGPQIYSARSAVHISINKAFLDKKLNVMLGVFDVLYKDYSSVSTVFSTQSSYWKGKDDTRRVRLTINYRFGKMQFQQRMSAEGDSRIKSGK